MINSQMPFRTFATIGATMIIRCLHLFPLGSGEVVNRRALFLCTSARLYRNVYFWMSQKVSAYLLWMGLPIVCSRFTPIFWMSSRVFFLYGLYAFWVRCFETCMSIPYLLWVGFRIRRLRSSNLVWMGLAVRFVMRSMFFRMFSSPCAATRFLFFWVCRITSTVNGSLFFRTFSHYFTPSRRAFSRIASSITPVMLNPNSLAMRWRSRFASGLSRRLVARVFSIPHYSTFLASCQARLCP